jgi:2-keto-4-pentenoate hydratase/2-oxohepta-3-ene-1,7-dioic acid hydratase in catechol pathway
MILIAVAGGLGRLEADGSVSVLDLPFPSVSALLSCLSTTTDHRGVLASLGGEAAQTSLAPDEVVFLPMLSPEAVVWGIGMNYRSKQLATGRPEPQEPTLFVKAASCFGVPGAPILLPAVFPDCVDYEAEIAFMIGTYLHEASEAEAARGVAGYLAADDVTARDVMRRTGNPSLAKSFPGFGQLGCSMACVEDASDLDDIPIESYVGDELCQRDDSSGMILSVGELVALLSRYVMLRPGDIVLTGTPAGTGDESGRYLQPGDTVEVRVGQLPPLTSAVAPSSAAATAAAFGASA